MKQLQILTIYQLKISNIGRKLYVFLNRKWFFDKVYHEFVSEPALYFGYHTSYKPIDCGLIEMFGPYGISSAISQGSRTVSRLQSGYLYHYAFSKYFCYIHWLMGYY